MFKLALVAFLCAQAFARPHEPEIESHIVGGTKAQEGEYPFIVSLRISGNLTFCGGALVSDRHVVTSANCVVNKSLLKIGAGSIHLANQKVFDVENITVHPKYKSVQSGNDIAVLKLKTPVPLGGNIQTINFPVTDNLDGKTVTALGWGKTSTLDPPSQVLMTLKRPIINNKDCAQRHKNPIYESQICLQGVKDSGISFGDYGSPLLYKGADDKNYMAGVVSWGFPVAQGYPDVFTRVSSFAEWIRQNMN